MGSEPNEVTAAVLQKKFRWLKAQVQVQVPASEEMVGGTKKTEVPHRLPISEVYNTLAMWEKWAHNVGYLLRPLRYTDASLTKGGRRCGTQPARRRWCPCALYQKHKAIQGQPLAFLVAPKDGCCGRQFQYDPSIDLMSIQNMAILSLWTLIAAPLTPILSVRPAPSTFPRGSGPASRKALVLLVYA